MNSEDLVIFTSLSDEILAKLPITTMITKKLLQSVPRYLCCTFGRFLIKIHLPVKEVQLKQLKGIFSKIISLTHYHLSLGKIHRNENRFLTEIYNGECLHLFSIRNTLGIHRAIFQRYHPGLLQYKISVDITFFSIVLKPDKLTGAF